MSWLYFTEKVVTVKPLSVSSLSPRCSFEDSCLLAADNTLATCDSLVAMATFSTAYHRPVTATDVVVVNNSLKKRSTSDTSVGLNSDDILPVVSANRVRLGFESTRFCYWINCGTADHNRHHHRLSSVLHATIFIMLCENGLMYFLDPGGSIHASTFHK